MNPRLRLAFVLLAASLALGLWVQIAGTPFFDAPVSRALWRARAQPELWRAISFLGDWEVRLGLGLAAAAWLARARGALAAWLFLAVVAAQGFVTSALKLLFARARPQLIDHLDATWDLSFPSGHAAQNACLWLLAAWLIDRRLLWVGAPLFLLIGIARVVLGVHWPSDVLGGWAAGAAFALVGVVVIDRHSPPACGRG